MALSFLKKPKIEKPKIGLTSGAGSHKYWKKYKSALGKWIYIYKKPDGTTSTSPAPTQTAPTRSVVTPQTTSGAPKVSSRPVPKPGTNATAAKKSDRPVPKPGTVEAKIDAGSQAVAASMQAAGVKPSNRPHAREKTVSEGTASVKKGEKIDTKNPLSDKGTVNAGAHSTAASNNKNKADSKSSEVSSAGVPKDENGNLDFSQFHREVEKADVEKADDEKAKNSKSTKSSGGGSSGSRSTSNQSQQTQQNNSSGTGNATLAEESEESKKLKEVYNSFAELVKSGALRLEDLPESIREEVEKLADPEGYELKRLEAVYGDFVKQIENGKISIDDVPENIREDVQKVLTAREKEKENGPSLDKPISEIDIESQEIKDAESFVDELLKKKED